MFCYPDNDPIKVKDYKAYLKSKGLTNDLDHPYAEAFFNLREKFLTDNQKQCMFAEMLLNAGRCGNKGRVIGLLEAYLSEYAGLVGRGNDVKKFVELLTPTLKAV